MKHSDSINEIATAMAKAQKVIKGAKKDSANPFFKSTYADLASVVDACRDALADNGIAVVQTPSATDDGRVSVTTMLVHGSGQWMSDALTVKPKDDGAQAMGSVITYLRRYSLAAFVGVAPEDDDGNAAEGRNNAKLAAVTKAAPKGYDDWLLDLEATALEGTDALQAAWKKSKDEYRTHLTTTNKAGWEALKSKAAKIPTQAVGA